MSRSDPVTSKRRRTNNRRWTDNRLSSGFVQPLHRDANAAEIGVPAFFGQTEVVHQPLARVLPFPLDEVSRRRAHRHLPLRHELVAHGRPFACARFRQPDHLPWRLVGFASPPRDGFAFSCVRPEYGSGRRTDLYTRRPICGVTRRIPEWGRVGQQGVLTGHAPRAQTFALNGYFLREVPQSPGSQNLIGAGAGGFRRRVSKPQNHVLRCGRGRERWSRPDGANFWLPVRRTRFSLPRASGGPAITAEVEL